MRQPIPLRADYDATRLRRIARRSDEADQVRRLLALSVIYDGGSRTERRPKPVASLCRWCGTGCSGSTPRALMP